ncbi:hypothetical protein ElyMa_003444000 [Elysia marginata]|uniref:Uncharacterized protein n=1 Tax=Elysia marginata TaxID=1093978 RepID=A0AAV4JRY2_9GAST|nr:hypothetical protein ElyMa_003444000 [Elysia marginata]
MLQSTPSAGQTGQVQENRDSTSLVMLSPAESCIILHRLGSAAHIPVLVTAVEEELSSLGVNIQAVLRQGIHGVHETDSSRFVKDDGQETKDAEEALNVDDGIEEKEFLHNKQGEERGKAAASLQRAPEIASTLSESGNNVLTDKELARSVLISCTKIFASTQSIEFV